MDELTAFKGAPVRLPLLERQLVRRADLVFTGGRSLYEAKRRLHPRTYCFPSSVDRAHYDRARGHGLRDPADQAKLPRPRIGFFGVIDERLDTGLVGEVAARRPDWQLVMVGPIVKIDAARLPRLPNLSWLGIKPYAELPDYLAHWDAGWMPFARNEATRYISPTKTPEFLAAGLPLVSTPIDDVVRDYGGDGLVEIAGDAQGCIAALARAMGRPRAPWLQQVDGRLRSMSWDRTWSTMQGLLAKVLDGGARPAAAMAGPVVPGTVVGEPAVGGIAAHA
jgi:UDP-galactopyranose mutase